jgi:hypothetical protein
LERARVALVPGVAFGPTGEAHLRLCYARNADDIERAFDRLEDYFAGRPQRSIGAPPAAAPPPPSPGRQLGVQLLRHAARVYLRRQRPRIVAVTGTSGKTVIKRALVELLAPRLRVRANPLSHNTAVGLPLAVLGRDLDTRHPLAAVRDLLRVLATGYLDREPVDVMVLELGIRRPGDMHAHLEILRPDVAIVTPLVPASSEDSEMLAVLRRETERLCAEASGRDAPALLLCADDPFLAALATRTPGAASFAREDVERQNGRLVLRLGPDALPVTRDVVGASGEWALSAAARVGRLLRLPEAEIAAFLAR